MDIKIRQAQSEVLKVFAKKPQGFALAGGTALELYYLHHRFSVDLDFFSPKYDIKGIERLVAEFKKSISNKIELISEFSTSDDKARVRFYSIPVKGSSRPLKIDFVEDVVFDKPSIKRFKGVPIYSAENIYLQKIYAVVGSSEAQDDMGRQVLGGRGQARDIFDIYMLSKKVLPLANFMEKLPLRLQRGMVCWYRSFSRKELKLALLGLDIYDKNFNAREMIIYLEGQVNKFMDKAIE